MEQYKDLSSSGARTGIMYGLAKVHKIATDDLLSFRPILSVISTPTYKLAKFLVPILEPSQPMSKLLRTLSHLQKNFKVLVQNM